jgi:hypothetical protein
MSDGATRTSFGLTIIGGQVDRLRRMATAAEEHRNNWVAHRNALADSTHAQRPGQGYSRGPSFTMSRR